MTNQLVSIPISFSLIHSSLNFYIFKERVTNTERTYENVKIISHKLSKTKHTEFLETLGEKKRNDDHQFIFFSPFFSYSFCIVKMKLIWLLLKPGPTFFSKKKWLKPVSDFRPLPPILLKHG